MVNYQNSIIYKLCCKDINITDIYIGSTTNFKARKSQHKSKVVTGCNFKVYKYIRENGGWENWDMVQIKSFPCSNIRELLAEERNSMEEYKAVLNSYIPYITNKERLEHNKELDKLYREKNKDKIKEKRKVYRENNKDKIKEKRIEYLLNNKEKVKEQKKIYYKKNKKKKKKN